MENVKFFHFSCRNVLPVGLGVGYLSEKHLTWLEAFVQGRLRGVELGG